MCWFLEEDAVFLASDSASWDGGPKVIASFATKTSQRQQVVKNTIEERMSRGQFFNLESDMCRKTVFWLAQFGFIFFVTKNIN